MSNPFSGDNFSLPFVHLLSIIAQMNKINGSRVVAADFTCECSDSRMEQYDDCAQNILRTGVTELRSN